MPTSAGTGAGATPRSRSSCLLGMPLAGRAFLHRESGGSGQESCHLIILNVSPRRLLTPTAADIS